MRLWDHLKIIFIFGPILGLLVLGCAISLGSGTECARASNPRGFRLFLGNFSRVLIRVVGYLAALFAVQQLVGFPLKLGW